MTTADRLIARGREEGLEKGFKQGREEGRLQKQRETLARLLRMRFGCAPEPSVLARIEGADEATLDRWTERLLTAESMAAVVAD